MTPEFIKTALVAIAAAIIFSVGWQVNGLRKDGQIARREIAQANERAKDAAESAAELQAAVSRGNELAARVAAAEANRDTALQETQDALRKVTTGRPCLDAGAVRLLNGPGLAAPVPATAGQPAGADAAAASDTDVAFWAAHARRAYDTCRGRIDALNEFFKVAE